MTLPKSVREFLVWQSFAEYHNNFIYTRHVNALKAGLVTFFFVLGITENFWYWSPLAWFVLDYWSLILRYRASKGYGEDLLFHWVVRTRMQFHPDTEQYMFAYNQWRKRQ